MVHGHSYRHRSRTTPPTDDSDEWQAHADSPHRLTLTGIAVRDSKNPTGPALLLPATPWTRFVTQLRETDSRD
ncbi:DUF397 domain-containing protein [Streptomyces sp. NPDC048504]|uniref:DUF397 domain-containing protein n=1 Tax=Streptomyces sp. NPDC048504 TaxID=3365559 RepID=UPI00371D5197